MPKVPHESNLKFEFATTLLSGDNPDENDVIHMSTIFASIPVMKFFETLNWVMNFMEGMVESATVHPGPSQYKKEVQETFDALNCMYTAMRDTFDNVNVTAIDADDVAALMMRIDLSNPLVIEKLKEWQDGILRHTVPVSFGKALIAELEGITESFEDRNFISDEVIEELSEALLEDDTRVGRMKKWRNARSD